MIQYIYQNHNVTFEDLYNQCVGLSDPDTFTTWFLDSINQNVIQFENTDVMSLEQFVKHRISRRKEKIREQLILEYLKTASIKNRKKRKSIKEAYKKSEQFIRDFENACQADPALIQMSNERSCYEQYSAYLRSQRDKDLKEIQKNLVAFCEAKRMELLREMLNSSIFHSYEDELVRILTDRICRILQTEKCISKYNRVSFHSYRTYSFGYSHEDTSRTEEIHDFIENYMLCPEEVISCLVYSNDFLDGYIIDFFFNEIPVLAALKNKDAWRNVFYETFEAELDEFKTDLLDEMDITRIFILENLMKNPYYANSGELFYRERRKDQDFDYFSTEEIEKIKHAEEQRKQLVEKSLLSAVPAKYIDLYPLARQMKRRFVLHIGPTNSGKTYHAIEALRKSGSGIYLAPLRLLAFEQYESLNKDGYPCSLITGEEKMLTPSATFQSSTIELADFTVQYQVAVIDEAQMLADENRGGAWTAAILGLCAQEIHICAAPHAQNILIRLIRECGDDVEVVRHKRETPLIVEENEFHFPKDVQEKDALIVFSRKNAHAVAAELQRRGRTCSVIYGSLPYNVRQKEARKFINGETEILVSTDAIGMGMNLPIRRVVFLETAKYDGKQKRRLQIEEIHQIAGRAGRKGLYDCGYVNCEEYKLFIAHMLQEAVPSIETAILRFPHSLLGIDASLSEILEQWNNLPCNPGYKKENISEQISLCKELEKCTDDKNLIYSFITIPFDSCNTRLKTIWRILFEDEHNQREYHFRDLVPVVNDRVYYENLNSLEEHYKVCDLLCFYIERFHGKEDYGEIQELKKRISMQIISILNKQKLAGKTCKYCGELMPWNHPYGICQCCYHVRSYEYLGF